MTIRMDCFSLNLPEQLEKLKWMGAFDEELQLIEEELNRNITRKLKDRLLLEKHIIPILKKEYIYTFKEAMELMRSLIPDFTNEEFLTLQSEHKIDWIYISGVPHYFRRFHRTLIKTEYSIAMRAHFGPDLVAENELQHKVEVLLFDTIHRLKEQKNMTYSFYIRHRLDIEKNSFCPGKIKVHLPLPVSCMQVGEMELVSAKPESYQLAESFVLQRTICFESELSSNEPFEVEYRFQNTVSYTEPDVDLVGRTLQPDLRAREFWADLGKQEPHIRFTPYLKELAWEVAGTENNALMKARKIYDYITKNIRYSFLREYITIQNIPEYTALNRKGDCGAQALLFITLCRIEGIPARWQSGLFTTPYAAKNHDWAMFYIAPYGWLFADCSFGGAAYQTLQNPLIQDNTVKKKAEEKWNFYFGNLDPFRMPSCSDFQREFSFSKQHQRNDPFDNQRGEAEYEDRALSFDELITEITVLKAEEI